MLRALEMSSFRLGMSALVTVLVALLGARTTDAQPGGKPYVPEDELPEEQPPDPPQEEQPEDPGDGDDDQLNPFEPRKAADPEPVVDERDTTVMSPFDSKPPESQEQVQYLQQAYQEGFAFGSYGRILAGTDLRGHTPEQISVVAHPPRIIEPSYVETDLYYHWHTEKNVAVKTVTTLAFGDSLFHYTGEFDARPALRNLYLEAELPSGLKLWGGSRMYRGDDIYLFDWWPLDDLNTLGAGASLRRADQDFAVHAGVNRLLDPFQHQTRDVSDPDFGSTEVEVLDRQRLIVSAAVTQFLHLGDFEQKVKLYAELQGMPEGKRRRADDTIEQLPRDWGLSLGAQLGVWTWGDQASANLFVRWSKGLSAFDELAAPEGLDDQHAAWPGASELIAGVGGAWNTPWRLAHVIVAAYSRRFVDADDSIQDRDDGWEYAIDVRPEVKIAGDVLAGVDLSYQVRFPRGLSPTTLLAADPAVAQIAPMIVYAPRGDNAYDRPQLRLVWRIARLNEAAIDQYATDDPRREHATVHFLGVQAEWWFNSSTR